jgi:hypothetical protein
MKRHLPQSCPGCGEELKVRSLQCPSCSTAIEGQFDMPLLCLLSREDQSFIISFIRHSGSLKKMSRELNQSYPTVRNRLNDLIEKLHRKEKQKEGEQ